MNGGSMLRSLSNVSRQESKGGEAKLRLVQGPMIRRIPGGNMIRVLVVDDHQIVRRGVRQILEEEADMEVAGEASSVTELMDRMSEASWDVILLDVSLPDGNGLEALRDIRLIRPSAKVIILSMHDEGQYAMRALRDGASGYVTKGGAVEEAVKAIRKVISGRRYVSPSLAEKFFEELEE
jgi:two-component system, NarL family, invasion response regulator UvrY